MEAPISSFSISLEMNCKIFINNRVQDRVTTGFFAFPHLGLLLWTLFIYKITTVISNFMLKKKKIRDAFYAGEPFLHTWVYKEISPSC